MFRIDSEGAVAAIESYGAVGGTVGYFSDGDPGLGVLATVVSRDWCNSVQESLCLAIEQKGLVLDKSVAGQSLLKKAMAMRTVRQLSASDTMGTYEEIVEMDASGGARNYTLLSAANGIWRKVTIIKTDSSANAVTLVGTISGIASPTLDTQYSSMTIYSNGTAWYQI